MVKENPYCLVFGKSPRELIKRIEPEEEIINTFKAENPTQQVYTITGIRGVGKTVFMTNIEHKLREEKNWITVELNPDRDLLMVLAAKLCSDQTLAELFKQAKINLSFFGIGLEVQNEVQITDIEVAIRRMLESLKAHGKRLLITIDEVSNTEHMRIFAGSFQILLRQDLPVYLLMTGLYENLYELKNEKNLTFLYRAPRIDLGPLNASVIKENYKENFELNDDQARQMAKMTKGYSFAFQVLGSLTWKAKGDYKSVQKEYCQYLSEYVYEKLWSELSEKDKDVLYAIAQTNGGMIIDIREKLNMTTNQFNPYRARLIRKGIVDGNTRGKLSFSLPFFKEFVSDMMIYELE